VQIAKQHTAYARVWMLGVAQQEGNRRGGHTWWGARRRRRTRRRPGRPA